MNNCTSIPTPDSFAPYIIRFLDCQALTIGAQGYGALASPGSAASIFLTGMTSLVIAFFGYRMLLGHTPNVREGVLTFVKIGLVLTIATSWPAYQVLVYDVILRSPAEFSVAIGSSAGLPGSGGGLVQRIDAVDQALKILAIEGVGSPQLGADGRPIMPSVPPPPFLGFDSFATGFARIIFLVATISSLAVVRIGAGLLLALAPLFAAFLLFDGTRGLFEGWAKALIGTAFASIAFAITLAVSLAFLEPWLAALLAARASDLPIMGAPAQILAATTIFALALGAVTYLVARITLGLHIPPWLKAVTYQSQAGSYHTAETRGPSPAAHIPHESRSRAAVIAGAVAEQQRQETNGTGSSGSRAQHIANSTARHVGNDRYMPITASGPKSRRIRQRVSSRASARDQRA